MDLFKSLFSFSFLLIISLNYGVFAVLRTFEPTDSLEYRHWFLAPKNGYFEFSVMLRDTEFYILLSQDIIYKSTIEPNLEINYDPPYWYISHNNKIVEKYTEEEENKISEPNYRTFWIKWHDGAYGIGEKGDKNKPIVSWESNEIFQVNYIAVSAGLSGNSTWIIDDEQHKITFNEFSDCSALSPAKAPPLKYFKEIETLSDHSQYEFYKVNGNCLRFKIKAKHDVNIMLTEGLNKADQMLEITLGDTHNTQSSIWKNSWNLMISLQKSILRENEFQNFWIKWSEKTIRVGENNYSNGFMNVEDSLGFQVNYVGIRTVNGANGLWIFENGDCPS